MFGPDDEVGTAIRTGWGVDDGEYRDPVPQQRDGNGTPALALQEGTGAIMRIDHPAKPGPRRALAWSGRDWRVEHARFLANETGRDQSEQAVAQQHLDFVIERRGDVIAEPRSIGTGELGGDQPAGLGRRRRDARENGGGDEGPGCEWLGIRGHCVSFNGGSILAVAA